MLYLWIKALHVISIIAWMAGLLYLPRLFVYHTQAAPGSEASETFKVMERRLLRAIMDPAMTAAYVFGITMLVLEPAWMKQGWLHAKLLFVLLLTASHILMGRWQKDFALDRNTRPQRFYRIVNEVPTLLMMGIVVFVIVKPF
ncbi:protoporphyrinogen oxidase HemJ [Azospirillum doebereinerae]|uniref:Protoporphyrinogen IX oxidase n=1 Tax=Azospirillum doebereinerae TaxID=92933 RepID=A0A433JBL5_9PROT|nr:protoporphyrinogen oxidase HemJ [Azospirillum doebereinerae]MCG5241919.1 protoporphyrinogen oxidase HemJ [Azospirillum doebereinerae]RUQ73749.1 protoporphyrinogen oxidase HemJ [Azospirillum doebereinerae]